MVKRGNVTGLVALALLTSCASGDPLTQRAPTTASSRLHFGAVTYLITQDGSTGLALLNIDGNGQALQFQQALDFRGWGIVDAQLDPANLAVRRSYFFRHSEPQGFRVEVEATSDGKQIAVRNRSGRVSRRVEADVDSVTMALSPDQPPVSSHLALPVVLLVASLKGKDTSHFPLLYEIGGRVVNVVMHVGSASVQSVGGTQIPVRAVSWLLAGSEGTAYVSRDSPVWLVRLEDHGAGMTWHARSLPTDRCPHDVALCNRLSSIPVPW